MVALYRQADRVKLWACTNGPGRGPCTGWIEMTVLPAGLGTAVLEVAALAKRCGMNFILMNFVF